MYLRLGTPRQIGFILFIFMLVIILLKNHLLEYRKCPSCSLLKSSNRSVIYYNSSSTIEDENTSLDHSSILCLDMAHHLHNERNLPQSPIISSPSYKSPQIFPFPYRYSHWNSSLILPRALTSCEHNVLMHLLMIIDRICRQHQIIYFISDGTLIGSLRHHDIIPWDDDLDILMSYEQRKIFIDAYERINQTLIGLYMIEEEIKQENYYKLYYKNSPSAGEYQWNFPFIDIFFYKQNETHLWAVRETDVQHELKDIFPLMLRPLGQLWVPAPRKSQHFFQFDLFDDCKSHFWTHRNETGQQEVKTKCNLLQDIYPFVEQNNVTDFQEILKINGTIIHTVILK